MFKYTSILIISLLFTFQVSAQIPKGYYKTTKRLTGSGLKTALNLIIKDHKEFPYTSKNTDVWDILKVTDIDTANRDNVILFYTGKSVNAQQEYNGGKGWNREHVWSKSRGDFGNRYGAGTDVHCIRPSNMRVNSSKNNRWFAECDEPLFNNSDYKLSGPWISKTQWVVKPRNAVKGDVARMIFYMAVRYEGADNEPDLELINYIPEDRNSKLPLYAKLSDLIKWHEQDPVDEGELKRNDFIYSQFQHNRNPFIDHPEFVRMIWNETGIIQTVSKEDEFKVIAFLKRVFPFLR